MPSTKRLVRIAGSSGSASDRRHAIAQFAQNYTIDPVDVIIADFMSEFNMSIAAGRKMDRAATWNHSDAARTSASTSAPGYEASFLEALEPALDDLARFGIKLAVNAGNTDTETLYHVVDRMVRSKGLNLKVAWVSGDEVLDTVKRSVSSGKAQFKNVYTGETLSEWAHSPIYAHCYLGGLGIAEALSQGANIVLCGRVSDASPVIGAAYWYHNWTRNDLQNLANALVAGHLIECSNYVCGGNFTGFKALQGQGPGGWSDIAYPIAEISAAGQVVITQQSYAAGGAVTVDTCSSQLLYEIQGPWYFNSDVTAILTDIHFEQIGPNRVAVRGVRSAPPPPTTKVGITARGGFQAEISWYLVGLDTQAKARMFESQIRRLLGPQASGFTSLSFSTLGTSQDDASCQNSATVTVRIVAQARTAADLSPARFLRPITDNIMQSYPGAMFNLDLRTGFPRPIFEYFVTLLPQADITHRVHLPWKKEHPDQATHSNAQEDGHDHQYQIVDVPPPPLTKEYPVRQPSQTTTANLHAPLNFGPAIRGPLGWIVHARSGDKGPDANCGFWVRHVDEYAWLRSLLSVETMTQLLGDEYVPSRVNVERFELPNLRAVHFLFRNLLDRGVGVTTTVDFLGKNVAEFLRARWVDLPVRFLGRGKL